MHFSVMNVVSFYEDDRNNANSSQFLQKNLKLTFNGCVFPCHKDFWLLTPINE
jgi:hypothetical protein